MLIIITIKINQKMKAYILKKVSIKIQVNFLIIETHPHNRILTLKVSFNIQCLQILKCRNFSKN